MDLYITLVCNALFTCVVIMAMGIFFKKRRTSLPVIVLSYLLDLFLTSLPLVLWDSMELINVMILNVLAALVALFIVSLNYESSMIKRVTAIGYMSFLFFAVSQLAWGFINALPIASLTDKISIDTLSSVLDVPLALLIASIFRWKFRNIKESTIDLPVLFWVLPLFIAVIANFLPFFSGLGLSQIVFSLVMAILVATSFAFFHLYDSLTEAHENKLKSMLHSQEREYYVSQCLLMQESVEGAKSIRHDIKSHLTALRGYAIAYQTDDITAYLDNLLKDTEENNIYSDTGNLAFDSIINYKLRNAQRDNVKLDVNMFIPPAFMIEVADIVTILGNLLDNALEAVSKVSEKGIKLIVKFDKGSLFIKTENSFNGEVVYSDEQAKKEGEKRQLASLKNGEGHVYGFNNIRHAIGKYGGHMDITYTENVFTVGVLILTGGNNLRS